MIEGKYNGWTNWETFTVNLWLTNDQPLYNHFRALAMSGNLKGFEMEVDAYLPKCPDGPLTPSRVNKYELYESFQDEE